MQEAIRNKAAPTQAVHDWFMDQYQPVTEIERSDVTLVFGRGDRALAEKVAELLKDGRVRQVLVTGGVGKDTGNIQGSEADFLADEMVKLGVPRSLILVEPFARNGGENCRFALDLLEKSGLLPTSMTLVGHPETLARLAATMRFALLQRKRVSTLQLCATTWTEGFDSNDPVCQQRTLGEFMKMMKGPYEKPIPHTVPVPLPENLVRQVWELFLPSETWIV